MLKPIPKTQKEISNSHIQPYSEVGYGNPNFVENKNEDESGIPHNRGKETSIGDTTSKPLVIGIQDIDEAIFYYFNNVIKPFVIQNGERVNVPIEYAAPEKWKSYRKDGYFRDKEGAIMLPLIIIKRNNITKNRSIANKLDANNPNMYYSAQTKYSKSNSYSNFNVLNNRKEEKQFMATVMPDYVTLTYSCIIQTYYMEQLNKIIEAVNYSSDSYWGDPQRFKFMTKVDSFSTNVEVSDGNDRLVKGNFDIKLNGYIIPDVMQKDLSTNVVFNSKSKITIGNEIVQNLN